MAQVQHVGCVSIFLYLSHAEKTNLNVYMYFVHLSHSLHILFYVFILMRVIKSYIFSINIYLIYINKKRPYIFYI